MFLILFLDFTMASLVSNRYANRRPGNEYRGQNTGYLTFGSAQWLPWGQEGGSYREVAIMGLKW